MNATVKRATGSKPIDLTLTLVVLALLVIGAIMVFSSSYYYSMSKFGDKFYFARSEVKHIAIGLCIMAAASKFPYPWLKKISPWLFYGSVLALILVLTPLGTEYKGARRWFDLGFITLMPSEIARMAGIFFFSNQLSKRNTDLSTFKELARYLFFIVLIAGLIALQPNKSTAVSISLTFAALLFVGGMRKLHMVIMGTAGFLGGLMIIMRDDYSRRRVLSFLNPFQDPQGDGWQVIQSLYALGNGGALGVGLGQSITNKLYIPEPANDLIFATIGEEFGYIGCVAILILFILLIYRGIKIALSAPDAFGFYIATGITATVAIQVIINIGVATSLLPPTGIPLPFISAGGTHLLMLMGGMGVLLNISRYRQS